VGFALRGCHADHAVMTAPSRLMFDRTGFRCNSVSTTTCVLPGQPRVAGLGPDRCGGSARGHLTTCIAILADAAVAGFPRRAHFALLFGACPLGACLAQRSAIGRACTTLHFSVRDVTQVPKWTEVGLCGTDSLPGWGPG
jgi:hypothetical protein